MHKEGKVMDERTMFELLEMYDAGEALMQVLEMLMPMTLLPEILL